MTPEHYKNLSPKKALLLRAIRTLNHNNSKDFLELGELNADLLATQVIAYILGVPVSYVIYNTFPKFYETYNK